MVSLILIRWKVIYPVDNVIPQINLHPVDHAIGFPNTSPLDNDLSGR